MPHFMDRREKGHIQANKKVELIETYSNDSSNGWVWQNKEELTWPVLSKRRKYMVLCHWWVCVNNSYKNVDKSEFLLCRYLNKELSRGILYNNKNKKWSTTSLSEITKIQSPKDAHAVTFVMFLSMTRRIQLRWLKHGETRSVVLAKLTIWLQLIKLQNNKAQEQLE